MNNMNLLDNIDNINANNLNKLNLNEIKGKRIEFNNISELKKCIKSINKNKNNNNYTYFVTREFNLVLFPI